VRIATPTPPGFIPDNSLENKKPCKCGLEKLLDSKSNDNKQEIIAAYHFLPLRNVLSINAKRNLNQSSFTW
jgi:hypothetical protein